MPKGTPPVGWDGDPPRHTNYTGMGTNGGPPTVLLQTPAMRRSVTEVVKDTISNKRPAVAPQGEGMSKGDRAQFELQQMLDDIDRQTSEHPKHKYQRMRDALRTRIEQDVKYFYEAPVTGSIQPSSDLQTVAYEKTAREGDVLINGMNAIYSSLDFIKLSPFRARMVLERMLRLYKDVEARIGAMGLMLHVGHLNGLMAAWDNADRGNDVPSATSS